MLAERVGVWPVYRNMKKESGSKRALSVVSLSSIPSCHRHQKLQPSKILPRYTVVKIISILLIRHPMTAQEVTMAGLNGHSRILLRRMLNSSNRPTALEPPASLSCHISSLPKSAHSPSSFETLLLKESCGIESLDTISRRFHPDLASELVFQPIFGPPPPPRACREENILVAAANSIAGEIWIAMPDTDIALAAARAIRTAALAPLRWRSASSTSRTEAAEFDAP